MLISSSAYIVYHLLCNSIPNPLKCFKSNCHFIQDCIKSSMLNTACIIDTSVCICVCLRPVLCATCELQDCIPEVWSCGRLPHMTWNWIWMEQRPQYCWMDSTHMTSHTEGLVSIAAQTAPACFHRGTAWTHTHLVVCNSSFSSALVNFLTEENIHVGTSALGRSVRAPESSPGSNFQSSWFRKLYVQTENAVLIISRVWSVPAWSSATVEVSENQRSNLSVCVCVWGATVIWRRHVETSGRLSSSSF